MSRYTGWLLPALIFLVMVGARGTSFGGTPQLAAGANHTVTLQADGTLWGAGLNVFGQLGDGSQVSRSSAVQIAPGSSWKAVAAGSDHTLAIRGDGTLWAWGRSDSGQLGSVRGNGSPVPNQSAPLQVSSERSWIAVAAGGASSYALKGDGTLWAWGRNSSGELGNGNVTQANTPVQVLNPGGAGYLAIAAGSGHALALQADGSLWVWGANGSGQLGDGTTIERHSPVQLVVAGLPSDNDWSAIAAGAGHSVALKADGTLWSWGGNAGGQLGDGSTASHAVPVQVGTGRDWGRIAAGSLHTLALKRNGTLWAFGDNRSGQIGNGGTAAQPAPVQIADGVVAAAGGAFHSLALKAGGEILAWGDNGTGQFGNGSTAGALAPVQVAGAATAWLSSEAGAQFTVALRSNGTLWGWGDNSNGQLGDGSLDPRTTPGVIGSARNWVSQSAGFSHTVALRGDGTLWSWGDNSSGQLGDNSLNASSVPLQIAGTSPSSAPDDWASVAAGDFHTLALKGDGTLWSWGDNSSGQLGQGANALNEKLPKQVVTGNPGNFDSNWIAVAAGGSHSLALQGDGTLWAWGDNSNGQLGDATIIGSTATPTQVVNFAPPAGNPGFNTNWKGIAAGFGHSLALQGDGTVWSFGGNFSGQLGDGSALNRAEPVQVQNPGLAPFVAIAAGDEHSAARQADGTLWSWGINTSGQLGTGSIDPDPFLTDPPTPPTPHATPVEAPGGEWIGAAAGGSHTVALKADGTLWGLGSNLSGQLGDGSSTDRSTPTPLLEGFLSVPASVDFSVVAIGGAAASLPLTVSNNGNGTLFVTALTLAGADSAAFTLQAGSCTGTASFALPAKGSCTLNILFGAALPQGGKSAQLLIDSSDPLHPQAQVGLSATSALPFTVTASAAPAAGGTISPAGPVSALPGATPTFTMSPAVGYHVADVQVNGVSKGALTTLRLDPLTGDVAVAVTFALNSYTVTLNAGPHGTIAGPTTVTHGATPSYTITPDLGSFITDVTVGGISQGVVSTVTLPAVQGNVTIAATFGVTTFGVSATSDARGSVSPAGTTQVPYGSSQSYQFTPNAGYQVVEVLVDGVRQGPLPSYTFSNVTGGAHTIRVIFIPDGDLTGDGAVDVADALKALRVAVNLDSASAADMLHGDVAPFDAAGIPVPDTQITVGDALGILRKAVGLASGF